MTFLWIENDSQFFSFLIHRFHSIWLNMIWFDSIDWIKCQAHHHHHRSCYRCWCQSIIDDWARFNYNQTHGMWCFFCFWQPLFFTLMMIMWNPIVIIIVYSLYDHTMLIITIDQPRSDWSIAIDVDADDDVGWINECYLSAKMCQIFFLN